MSNNWHTTQFCLLHLSFMTMLLSLMTNAISAYILPEHSQLSTVWSPLLYLVFVPTNPPAYTLTKPGFTCLLKYSWPLPHPCPQLTHCQKCSPPATSSVKSPSTLMVCFRSGIPWSKALPWVPALCVLTPSRKSWGPWFVLWFWQLFSPP